MKNIELSLEQLSMLRTALGLLEYEAFQRVEENGIDCFTESEEEKYFHKVSKLYSFISELEDELEEEQED